MLAWKFHFILYFYLPLELCNFNYSNLLLLINNSFDIRHCNHHLAAKLVSFISFVLPIYHKAATGFLFLSSFFYNQDHRNKQVSAVVDSHAYNPLVWVASQNLPLILYCEHFQHFTKEISSSCFMFQPKYRPRLIKK